MSKSDELINQVRTAPQSIQFDDVMQTIQAEYDFHPVKFVNGKQINAADQNQGSCKLLAFAMLHQLSEFETLCLVGEFYRRDVLENPLGQDHQNIRQFIENGWSGVHFEAPPLLPK